MADFQGIFCRPFPPSVLIIEGVGGMGGRVGWGGVGWGGVGRGGVGREVAKTTPRDTLSSHDAHTVANDTSVGQIASGSKSRSPLPNWRPPWVPLFQP